MRKGLYIHVFLMLIGNIFTNAQNDSIHLNKNIDIYVEMGILNTRTKKVSYNYGDEIQIPNRGNVDINMGVGVLKTIKYKYLLDFRAGWYNMENKFISLTNGYYTCVDTINPNMRIEKRVYTTPMRITETQNLIYFSAGFGKVVPISSSVSWSGLLRITYMSKMNYNRKYSTYTREETIITSYDSSGYVSMTQYTMRGYGSQDEFEYKPQKISDWINRMNFVSIGFANEIKRKINKKTCLSIEVPIYYYLYGADNTNKWNVGFTIKFFFKL